MDYQESTKIIHNAMFHRERGRFDECIKLMQDNLSAIEPDLRLVALIQIFGAARGKHDETLARQTAGEIAKTDPELPSIKSYL